MNEKLLKLKIIKNLLENKEKFLCSEASSTDADNSKLGKGANDDKATNINSKNANKGEGVNTDRNVEDANTDSKGSKGTSINNKGEVVKE
ncbi:hypothetical protein RclHR1_17210003 [Rhizophagus clarus]|uniref:Uncharacterized protein n=1 Tax=Rhizophagus clarus TaxID=94130 RepID=A0A2Z6QYG5_9GLOM|nr:hypothetical protein RclHR1_17210003 [Rhizophagus clarus]